jgi:light-regulated signal transduction histidine kinase (bacteriophytochrome)
VLGRPLSDVYVGTAIPTTPWQLLERAPSGKLPQLDVEIRTQTGRTLPLSISCGLVRDRRGKITGLLIVGRDISERKRAEATLRQQAQELARSNAELEQFAYVASHDLKEPLRMIASFSDLLVAEYRGALDGDAHEYLDFIVDNVARMQNLITDLLDYARVSTQGKPFASVDSAAVLAITARNLQAAIAESQATLIYPDLPTVLGDETQLVQLFQNLIGNAIKFRADRPVEVTVGAERRGAQWLFWVRDNGIGIEPESAERIFVIFQRLQSRAESPGTGIGLAICKKIVERHGGQIWVESEPGQGSTFYFLLPTLDSGTEPHTAVS